MGKSNDAATIPQCLHQGFSEYDADILDGVVVVDVGVTPGFDVEPQTAVGREGVQHVAEEAAGHVDAALAAVQVEGEADGRLAGGALDGGASHGWFSGLKKGVKSSLVPPFEKGGLGGIFCPRVSRYASVTPRLKSPSSSPFAKGGEPEI